MKRAIIQVFICMLLAGCKKTEQEMPTSNTKVSYVFNVVKEKNSSPLNLYCFYIDNEVDTATAKYFRVDLDSNNVAVFTLPKGVNAVQKVKDSITVALNTNNLYGATIMRSAANKGVIGKIEQSLYINGETPGISYYESDSLYLFTFQLEEYKKGALMRTSDYGMYLHKLK